MASNDKYDRQKRLWGELGQERILKSKICLLGAETAGCEALKNLVLPGLGNITIVDGNCVSDADLGNNFYVELSDLGKPRAQAVLAHMLEMNSDAQGEAICQDHLKLSKDPNFLKNYTIIIANEFFDEDAIVLSREAEKLNIKVIFINTNGFIGSIRIQAGFHAVIESKPEGNFWDLRMIKPFKQLQEYVNKFDLPAHFGQKDDKNVSYALAHIPYIVIQIKALQEWLKTHQDAPKSFAEKSEYKSIIVTWMKANLNPADRENFEQAIDNAHQVHKNPSELPQTLESQFDNPHCDAAGPKSQTYWIMIKALKIFYQQNGNVLPVNHRIPDIDLKEAFKLKYTEDFEALKSIIKNILELPKEQGLITITDDEIKLLIENVLVIDEVEYKPFYQELEKPNQFEDFDNNCWKWYIGLRAFNQFYQQNKRLPNPQDEAQLHELVKNYRQKFFSESEEIGPEFAKEFCRYEGSKLNTIGSILGAIVSQEVIKLVTKQFMPFKNTYIYDGTKCDSIVFDI